jgi:hypothetical protein
MNLLETEEELTLLNNRNTISEQLVLTNYRIIYNSKKTMYKSIFLEDISSFEVKSSIKSILLLIGIILILFGFFNLIPNKNFINEMIGVKNGNIPSILLLALGILFIILYVLSEVNYVIICSKGGTSIEFNAKMKQSELEDILYKIQEAKLNRVNHLS